MSDQADNLRWITVCNLAWAKRWIVWFWGSQVVALGINALTAFNEFPAIWGALTGLLLATGAELFRWRSDFYRAKGELFKRNLEVFEGFGGYDFATEMADERATRSDAAYDSADKSLEEGSKYASGAPAGPMRALENLHESAWFSKHLARRAGVWASVFVAMAIFVAVVALVSAIGFVDVKSAAGAQAAKAGVGSAAFAARVVGTVVCGVLTFLVAINLFRYAIELHQFAGAAAQTVRKVEQMGGSQQVGVAVVQALLFEYQLARQAAPMIPTWVWRRNRERLNRLWPEASKRLHP